MQSLDRVAAVARKLPEAKSRRGAILVLAAILLILVFAMAAFAIDVSYMTLVSNELQNAADSAALSAVTYLNDGEAKVIAEAVAMAEKNKAGATGTIVRAQDVELGRFNLDTHVFTKTSTNPNAVRVNARAVDRPYFFANVIGKKKFTMQRSATAMLNPRDIVFIVDLSGSMNDDSEPCWATSYITSEFTPKGYPNAGTNIMSKVFSDFGFGAYPGTTQYIGKTLNVAENNNAYAEMTKQNGPLTSSSIASTYRIVSSDSEATRKTKAYKYIIDKQIAVVMPNAKPAPSSSNTTSFDYWSKYLDYIIESKSVSSGRPQSGSVTLPPSQDGDRIDDYNNPNLASFPSATVNVPRGWRNKIGYITYVQFMMDHGRDRSPDADASNNASPSVGTKTPLSVLSPHCPYHSEATAGGTFSFPPSEQPTHACRRSLIAAIQEIKTKNLGLADGVGDRVGIVTFDAIDAYHAPKVAIALTSDYNAAMQTCTKLQAVSDVGSSTATENGIILARKHLLPASQGGAGRTFTTKVAVLLTDGMPNIYQSSNTTINSYISGNPNADYYSSAYGAYNSVLMQCAQMNGEKDRMFPVGMGLGADESFMDKVARISGTDEKGLSPRGTGNPADYEDRLTEIFREIINTRGGRLVQ